MYVVVRADLTPAQQAVQTAHVLADFAAEHPEEFLRWNDGNNTLVVLTVPNENELTKLQTIADDGELSYTVFFEPDLGRLGQKSALAFAPNWFVQYVLLKDLPLALPDPPPSFLDKWGDVIIPAVGAIFFVAIWLLVVMKGLT
jgi:hypothetical protein